MLAQLKAIKARKLDKAQQALASAQANILEKKKQVEVAKQKLTQYISWREAKEDALYEQAYREYLSAAGLDDLRYEIGQLRAKDAILNQQILDAEHQVDLAVAQRNECQLAVQQAHKVLEKYLTLLAQEAKQRQREQEKQEEESLDDLVTARFSGAVR